MGDSITAGTKQEVIMKPESATRERLVEAIEAVLKEASDADQQDRLISPDILRKRLTSKLTGEDDDQ